MTSDDEYADLPEDNDQAFIYLEKKFRADLESNLERAESSSAYKHFYQEYINLTLAAAQELDIGFFNNFEASDTQSYDVYRNFSLAVAQYTTQIKIRHSRRTKRYSVALDHATKRKIRHHLQQLKELTDQLGVPSAKREAILAKIVALEMEMERERTRFEIVAALILETATVGGEVGQKLEPWRKWIDSIAKLLGVAKETDTQNPSLPLPDDRKKLDPPRPKLPPPGKSNVGDGGDVPF